MRWRFSSFSCSRYPPLPLFVGFERSCSEMASMVGRAGGFRILLLRQPFAHCRRLLASVPRSSSLQPPDIPALADAARISLSQKEMEDFAPKIRQVIDWFGQLQDIDLECVQPSVRADFELDSVAREDSPQTFENSETNWPSPPSICLTALLFQGGDFG
ncbi:hypothetical protein KSP39_PZI021173 [Platanthera zijinensis]|uniref:Glutamyl-tRNA(Gln) amidotransferase subunit C, chloroplastic/mitochondrial n=1 Tax=Platanthera zijinensis TaxID=2320716 RepID=A0AAP0AXK6_9ASPA